jgi:hypothetical protein
MHAGIVVAILHISSQQVAYAKLSDARIASIAGMKVLRRFVTFVSMVYAKLWEQLGAV